MNDLDLAPTAFGLPTSPACPARYMFEVEKADGSRWVADLPHGASENGVNRVSWDGETLTAYFPGGRKEDISALLREAPPARLSRVEDALMQAARSLWFAAMVVAVLDKAGEALSHGLQADAWSAESAARRLPLDYGPEHSTLRPEYADNLPPLDGITPGEGSQVLKREREASANG